MPASAATAAKRRHDPAERIVRFFARRLRHVQGPLAGEPFMLEPWQEHEIVRPLFGALNPDGTRRFTEGLVGISRKNGKSTVAAGIALYGAFADGYYDRSGIWHPEMGAEVFVCAGSRQQAKVIFNVARAMVMRDPFLRSLCAGSIYRDAIEVPETGAVFRVLSSDAKLAHGYNPSIAILDELHVHPNDALYEAMTTGTGARKQPLTLSITTAGHDRTSIAYKLYERGKRSRGKGRFFFYWREAPPGCRIDDRLAWRVANPAKHITQKFLADQLRRPGMTEFSFRRLHLNQWTSAERRVIPRERWDACAAKPSFPEGSEVILAVDVAPRGHDRTVVVLTRRDEDGQIHAHVTLFRVDPDIGIVDYEAIEDLIRSYARKFRVREAAYDPYYFDPNALTLLEEGIPMTRFEQNDARMVPASQALYVAIMEGRIRHGGDPVFTEHADNAGAWEKARGWRFHKAKSSGPIDAIVALAMAVDRWERGEEQEVSPSVIVG